MECAICHRQEASKTRCVNGHYVCSDCHTQGMDSIFGLCLSETSTDPVAIIRRMMDLPFCHMHGPEHHVMVGAALLTAYKNAGGSLDLEKALREIYSRGKAVPGGGLRLLGRLRSRDQRRAVPGHCHPVHSPGAGALGPEQSDDRPGTRQHRKGRRPALLQAGLFPGCSRCRGLCQGASGCGNATDHSRLHLQQPERAVHRQPLPLLTGCR